jgi:hypothetical protein
MDINLLKIVSSFLVKPKMKLLDWINENNLNIDTLCLNPNAIYYLETKMFDKINWEYLSCNPNAIHILEKNIDMVKWRCLSANPNAINMLENYILENNLDDPDVEISWHLLSGNPNAIHILEKYPDKIIWEGLSKNPNAIHILKKNPDKINWYRLSSNINAIHLLESELQNNPNKIDWFQLTDNINALHIIENNFEKYNSYYPCKIVHSDDKTILAKLILMFTNCHNYQLCRYPENIMIDNIDLKFLYDNQKIINILKQDEELSSALSKNPNAIDFLHKHQDLIFWEHFSLNAGIFEVDMKLFRQDIDMKSKDIDVFI